MKKLSKILAVSILALILGAFAACGSDDDEIVIRISTWDSGAALGFLEEIARNFEAEHSHITIQVESVPDGLGASILTQLAGGDAPDIFQIGDGDISMFHSRGALVDLTPHINGPNPLDLNLFFDPILEVGRIDGGVFAFPKDYSTIAVYYNRDMFDAAGIPHPTGDWTWDEFAEIARQLTIIGDDGNVERWGVNWAGGHRWVLPIIYGMGGDVISPDGMTVQGYVNSPGTIAGMQWFHNLMNVDRAIPSTIDIGGLQGVNLFMSELSAMNVTGVWPANGFLEAGLNFGTAPLPRGPVGHYGTIAYAGYVMTRDSNHPEEAWLFLRYLVTEGQYIMAQHALSAYIPAAQATGQHETPHLQAFIDMIEVTRVFPQRVNADWYGSAGRHFSSVLEEINLAQNNPIDIAALLNEAATQGQAEMEDAMSQRD